MTDLYIVAGNGIAVLCQKKFVHIILDVRAKEDTAVGAADLKQQGGIVLIVLSLPDMGDCGIVIGIIDREGKTADVKYIAAL